MSRIKSDIDHTGNLVTWNPILLSSSELEVSAVSALVRGQSLPPDVEIDLGFQPKQHWGTPRHCMANTWLQCDERTRIRVMNLTQACGYLLQPNKPSAPRNSKDNKLSSTTPISSSPLAPITFNPFIISKDENFSINNLEINKDKDFGEQDNMAQPLAEMPLLPVKSWQCNEYFTYSAGSSEKPHEFSFRLTLDYSGSIRVLPDFSTSAWTFLECFHPVTNGLHRLISSVTLGGPTERNIHKQTTGYMRDFSKPTTGASAILTTSPSSTQFAPNRSCNIRFKCSSRRIAVDGHCAYPYLTLLQMTSLPNVNQTDFNAAVRQVEANYNFLGDPRDLKNLVPDLASCFNKRVDPDGNEALIFYGIYRNKIHESLGLSGVKNQAISVDRLRAVVADLYLSEAFSVETVRVCFVVKDVYKEINLGGETSTVPNSREVNPEMSNNEINICDQKPWAYDTNLMSADTSQLCEDLSPSNIRDDFNRGLSFPCKEPGTCVEQETRNAVATLITNVSILVTTIVILTV